MLITLSLWPKRRRPNTTGSRTAPRPFLSDAQWNLIKHLFEYPDPSPLGGRPRLAAVSSSLDGGSHDQLAAELPATAGSP